MTDGKGLRRVELIPTNEIHVLNPRARGRRVFEEIKQNIGRIGLKRPITVTLRRKPEVSIRYNLVCGEGRLEAFIALGQSTIPAVIIDTDEENC